MKLITDSSDTITDRDGNVVYICLEGEESLTIPLTYTMVRASGISPSMVYALVHGDGIFLGEDKFVRTYEGPQVVISKLNKKRKYEEPQTDVIG